MQVSELVAVVSRNVRHYRKAARMTQADLASAVGTHQEYISDIERGKVKISLEMIARLGESLGIEPHVLMLKPTLEKIS